MPRRIKTFATAAGTPVASTGTEGTVARQFFGVGELQPGRVIEYEALIRTTATVSTDTAQIRVRFGTSSTVTSNTAIVTGTATDVANNYMVLVTGRIHIQSDTRYVHTGRMDNPPNSTGNVTPISYGVPYTATADTAYYLDVTVDWSTSSANSAQAECWAVWEDEV